MAKQAETCHMPASNLEDFLFLLMFPADKKFQRCRKKLPAREFLTTERIIFIKDQR
jgi:hypothetical protein